MGISAAPATSVTWAPCHMVPFLPLFTSTIRAAFQVVVIGPALSLEAHIGEAGRRRRRPARSPGRRAGHFLALTSPSASRPLSSSAPVSFPGNAVSVSQAEAAAKRRRAEAEAEAAKDALFDSKMAALEEVPHRLH